MLMEVLCYIYENISIKYSHYKTTKFEGIFICLPEMERAKKPHHMSDNQLLLNTIKDYREIRIVIVLFVHSLQSSKNGVSWSIISTGG